MDVPKIRIAVSDLPPRETERTDESLDRMLHRLGAGEGSACRMNCDCRIGLFCIDDVCARRE